MIKKNENAFVLIEVLVVIAIIAVLAAGIVTINILRSRQAAEEALCVYTRGLIEKAELQYTANKGEHSSNPQDLIDEGYLTSYPKCPADGIYAWQPYEATDAKYQTILGCSVHGGQNGDGVVWNPDEGRVAFWNMDEGAGSTAGGDDLVGEIYGAEWVADEERGTVLSFDGDGDYVKFSNSDQLNIQGDQMTLGVWFKLPENGDGGALVFKNTQYLMRLDSFGRASFMVYNPKWSYVSMSGSDRITDTEWHYATGTYDGQSLKVYIDGKELASSPSTGDIKPKTADVLVGSQVAGTNEFEGLMDEVSIYNRALTAEEVQLLYRE